jgi:hypothetical protein
VLLASAQTSPKPSITHYRLFGKARVGPKAPRELLAYGAFGNR